MEGKRRWQRVGNINIKEHGVVKNKQGREHITGERNNIDRGRRGREEKENRQ